MTLARNVGGSLLESPLAEDKVEGARRKKEHGSDERDQDGVSVCVIWCVCFNKGGAHFVPLQMKQKIGNSFK